MQDWQLNSMIFQAWKMKLLISKFSMTRTYPGALLTQKRYFPSVRFWLQKLTLHILVAGTALNVLNKLALTPGGGSKTNTRDALSKFTGTYCNKDSIFNWVVFKMYHSGLSMSQPNSPTRRRGEQGFSLFYRRLPCLGKLLSGQTQTQISIHLPNKFILHVTDSLRPGWG